MAGLEWQARRGKLVLFSYVLSMEIQGRCLEPSSAACPEPFKCHGASASLKRLAASGSLLWTPHVVLPTTLAPFLWSIFPFPDVTEVIQAENVFGSLCICRTTNIKVSSLLVTRNNPTLPALPASPPPPPSCHQLSLQPWSNQLPLPACSKHQMALPTLMSIFVWIRWMKCSIERNY